MKIVVFPKDPNPYQNLLYGEMPATFEIKYLHASRKSAVQALLYYPRILIQLIMNRVDGFSIIHIHWLYSLALPKRIPGAKQISYIYSRFFLSVVKLLGYKVIWTVHNVLPHEELTSNDSKIRNKLSSMTKAKIVHEKNTIQEMKKLGLDVTNCQIIPHGNYMKAYPNTISRTNARKTLHIPGNSKVIIFFGRVEPYKHVPSLIEAYQEIVKKQDDLYLLIAGKCSNLKVRQKLEDAVNNSDGRILFHDRHISDKEVQTFFNAADICAYPFKEITTSGSVLLAATFGKPIVAPYIGAIKDIPRNAGQFYDPSQEKALKKSILAALPDPQTKKMAAASLAYAKSLSWQHIAEQTQKVYQSVEI